MEQLAKFSQKDKLESGGQVSDLRSKEAERNGYFAILLIGTIAFTIGGVFAMKVTTIRPNAANTMNTSSTTTNVKTITPSIASYNTTIPRSTILATSPRITSSTTITPIVTTTSTPSSLTTNPDATSPRITSSTTITPTTAITSSYHLSIINLNTNHFSSVSPTTFTHVSTTKFSTQQTQPSSTIRCLERKPQFCNGTQICAKLYPQTKKNGDPHIITFDDANINCSQCPEVTRESVKSLEVSDNCELQIYLDENYEADFVFPRKIFYRVPYSLNPVTVWASKYSRRWELVLFEGRKKLNDMTQNEKHNNIATEHFENETKFSIADINKHWNLTQMKSYKCRCN